MKTKKSHLLAYVCASGILSACGGGSESSTFKAELNGPMQGFISIEERSNKRVVDAWFSQGVVPEQSTVALWNDGNERCVELLGLNSSESSNASQVGSRWRDTLFAGEAIRIESRTGEITRLQAQRFGDAVLYASAERWIAEPLPDDAQIMITGSDEFPTFDAIPVAPLTRLVRIAPTNGVTDDLSTAIAWEVSESNDDSIELTVAASDNTQQGASSIKCWLNDRGQFVLPEAVRRVLPENRQSIVSLVRTRRATHESGGAQLHLTQSSYP